MTAPSGYGFVIASGLTHRVAWHGCSSTRTTYTGATAFLNVQETSRAITPAPPLRSLIIIACLKCGCVVHFVRMEPMEELACYRRTFECPPCGTASTSRVRCADQATMERIVRNTKKKPVIVINE